MVSDDNFYSQFVSILKITLPLAALGLMSTVFLFARAPTEETTIPYAEIEEIAREPRVSGPQVSGVSEDGSIIEITARTARPAGDLLIIDTMAATIDTLDGTRIDVRSHTGEINTVEQSARLTGLVRIDTSNGYHMETSAITANMTTGRLFTDGALEVQAPYGTLTAGKMIIETPEGASGQVMLFQNGVRLIYIAEQ